MTEELERIDPCNDSTCEAYRHLLAEDVKMTERERCYKIASDLKQFEVAWHIKNDA